MRAHHPREYMASLISSVMSTKDRVPFYVNACDEMGIEVLPPDVNESQLDFAVVEGKIRFGLSAVKNVGEPAARAIIRGREEGGAFASIWDFTERVDPQASNKRALESLVKCGALDSTGATRKGMLDALESALSHGARAQTDRLLGQSSLFGEEEKLENVPISGDEFEKSELLRLEKEVLGLYVSEHPLHSVRDQLRRKTDCALADVERRRDGETVTVGGIVSALKHLTTKKGEPMVFMRLDDVTGGAEVVVFNSVYAHARELCVMDRILIVKGRIDHKQEGETKLLAMEVAPFEAVAERKEVTIKIDARIARAGVVRDLALLVKDFPGDSRVNLLLEMSEGTKQFVLGPQYKVKPVAGLLRRGEGAARRSCHPLGRWTTSRSSPPRSASRRRPIGRSCSSNTTPSGRACSSRQPTQIRGCARRRRVGDPPRRLDLGAGAGGEAAASTSTSSSPTRPTRTRTSRSWRRRVTSSAFASRTGSSTGCSAATSRR